MQHKQNVSIHKIFVIRDFSGSVLGLGGYSDMVPVTEPPGNKFEIVPNAFISGIPKMLYNLSVGAMYRGADKSLARLGRKQATATKL